MATQPKSPEKSGKMEISLHSLASAFYQGCGNAVKVLGEFMFGWVSDAIEWTRDKLRQAKKWITDKINTVKNWVSSFWDWLGKNPVIQAAKAIGGAMYFMFAAPIAAVRGCLHGVYDSLPDGGKWAVGAGLGAAAFIGLAKSGAALVAGMVAAAVLLPIAPVANWMVQTTQSLWRFNWNITASEIDRTIDNSLTALAGIVGSGLGQVLGVATCGILPGVKTVAIAPHLLAHIQKELGQEAYEEIRTSLWSVMVGVRRTLQTMFFLKAYQGVRHFIKWAVRKSDLLQILVGKRATEIISKWGEEGSKKFSFAQSFENYIDNLEDKNKKLANFLEEFFEEFGETCGEFFVTWARSVDLAYP